MIGEQPQGATLRIGKVVKVHPSDHSVDIVLLDNGAKMANVQTLAPTASTRSGRVDLPVPDLPDSQNPWSLKMSETQDLLAVIAMVEGTPFCLGFLYPQVNQLAMPEETQNLAIQRHASDWYQVITDGAVMTLHHPGGAYISMGGGYIDLTGKDFDQKWKLERNRHPISITIYTPDGGHHSLIVCAPNSILLETTGSITGNARGNISLHAGGNVDIQAGGNITAHAGGSVVVQGQTIQLN